MIPSIVAAMTRTKPVIPQFKPIDIGTELGTTIRANQKNFQGASEFSSATTDFNTGEMMRAVRLANPDYDKIANGMNTNILSMLKGEIDPDVAAQTIRHSAEGAAKGGYANSGAKQSLTARDLGLTSLAVKQQGMTSAQSWLGQTNALARPAEIGGNFISGESGLALAERDRDAKYQRDYASNMNDAQYSTMSRMANAGEQVDAQMMQLTTSMMGSL